MVTEIVQTIGYEWCINGNAHLIPHGISVQTLGGEVIMLYRVERFQSDDAGGTRLVMVRPSEVKKSQGYRWRYD